MSSQIPARAGLEMQSGNAGHEQVIVRRDEASGLTAVIALHNTRLGPAAGGCRRWRYIDLNAGIADAMRLSEGMTYKNALAGIPFGGGKSVILADARKAPTAAQLRLFAGWLNELQGRYITAEDVGMGVAQMQRLAQHTRFVSGLGQNGVGGDPSPKTAYGVFLGLKTAVQYKLGVQHLYGVRVAVQGLGSVGMSLCHWLARAGADLVVADLNRQRVQMAVHKYDALAAHVDEIAEVQADVFAPCALGGVVNETAAERTGVQVIAGAANNQLANPHCGEILAERGVLYAPDFVINAGGMISVAHEYLMQSGQFHADPLHSVEGWVASRIDGIASRLTRIIDSAQATQQSTEAVAKRLAMDIVEGRAEADARAA